MTRLKSFRTVIQEMSSKKLSGYLKKVAPSYLSAKKSRYAGYHRAYKRLYGGAQSGWSAADIRGMVDG